uniref:Uncharacterized protein n=1 Tax=Tanacetum cinerariifolium TaxID=118510 RepID=A0A6L2MAX8_TANCI|nr:hypothetical protein [Tanacetum cinerariifolium]
MYPAGQIIKDPVLNVIEDSYYVIDCERSLHSKKFTLIRRIDVTHYDVRGRSTAYVLRMICRLNISTHCVGIKRLLSAIEVTAAGYAKVNAASEYVYYCLSLSSDYNKFVSYKVGLQSVKDRLVNYKKNEAIIEEKINILNLEVRLRDNALVKYIKKLEKAEKERDELKLTLEKFQNSSKSLNNLLESQVSDKVKTELGYKAASLTKESFVKSSRMLENQENVKSRSDKGYHAVPSPYTRNYIPPKPDLMFIDAQVKSKYVNVVSNVTSSAVKTVEQKVDKEDIVKLIELIELSTKLSDRVLDLEKIKTAQAKEIADLKKRVKKLERKRRSRTPRMNLIKIGTSRRRSLGEEDASKQERNLKQRSIFKESNFDVQAMMDAVYELAARLKAKEKRRKPLTKSQKRNQI